MFSGYFREGGGGEGGPCLKKRKSSGPSPAPFCAADLRSAAGAGASLSEELLSGDSARSRSRRRSSASHSCRRGHSCCSMHYPKMGTALLQPRHAALFNKSMIIAKHPICWLSNLFCSLSHLVTRQPIADRTLHVCTHDSLLFL